MKQSIEQMILEGFREDSDNLRRDLVPTYSVLFKCRNCGKIKKHSFERGKAAPRKVECNNCGCPTAFQAGKWG